MDPKEFCDKIKSLKLGLPEDVSCDYDNIRRYCNLTFMSLDFELVDEGLIDNREKDVFLWCREIAMKLAIPRKVKYQNNTNNTKVLPKYYQIITKTFQLLWDVFFMPNFVIEFSQERVSTNTQTTDYIVSLNKNL